MIVHAIDHPNTYLAALALEKGWNGSRQTGVLPVFWALSGVTPGMGKTEG
jgi:hypothetical protein